MKTIILSPTCQFGEDCRGESGGSVKEGLRWSGLSKSFSIQIQTGREIKAAMIILVTWSTSGLLRMIILLLLIELPASWNNIDHTYVGILSYCSSGSSPYLGREEAQFNQGTTGLNYLSYYCNNCMKPLRMTNYQFEVRYHYIFIPVWLFSCSALGRQMSITCWLSSLTWMGWYVLIQGWCATWGRASWTVSSSSMNRW